MSLVLVGTTVFTVLPLPRELDPYAPTRVEETVILIYTKHTFHQCYIMHSCY